MRASHIVLWVLGNNTAASVRSKLASGAGMNLPGAGRGRILAVGVSEKRPGLIRVTIDPRTTEGRSLDDIVSRVRVTLAGAVVLPYAPPVDFKMPAEPRRPGRGELVALTLAALVSAQTVATVADALARLRRRRPR